VILYYIVQGPTGPDGLQGEKGDPVSEYATLYLNIVQYYNYNKYCDWHHFSVYVV
jgi:hypothetical protein